MKKLFRVVVSTYINSICARRTICLRYMPMRPVEILYKTDNFFEAANHLECEVHKFIHRYFYYYGNGEEWSWTVKENEFQSLKIEKTYEPLEDYSFSLDYLIENLPADEMIEYMKDRGMNCSFWEKN